MQSRHASRSDRKGRWAVALSTTVFFCALSGWSCSAIGSETVFTYRSGESEHDSRYRYQAEALRLALEKTRGTYGPYRLEASPAMVAPRVLIALNKNQFPNFFAELSYDEVHLESGNLMHIPFPVDRGIVGYRVCFAHEDAKERLSRARTLEDLRSFRMGLGTGWADVKVLRHSGFNVVEGPNYEGLFQMLALKRFDLFCRGTNEIREEWEAHRNVPGLSVETTFAIAYPLPRFFYTHKSNARAAQRVEKGLLLAYQDGSLQALWHKHYRSSLEFARLKERRFFWLENPLVKTLDPSYRKYNYDPLTDTAREFKEIKKAR